MRKVLFVIASVFTLSAVNAQTSKGTLLLGGQASFNANTTSGGGSYFIASPQIGGFVADNVAVGAAADLATGGGSTAYSIMPFVRPYFGGSDAGKFFAQAKAGLAGTSGEGGSDTNFGYGAGVGYAIFLNQSTALELGVNYASFGSGTGVISVGVGFQIHFKK